MKSPSSPPLVLRGSQQVALAKLCEPGRTYAALWAEPRSGKTAVCLRWLEHLKPKVVVIVGPKIAEQVWRTEASKWFTTPYQFYPLTVGNDYPSVREFRHMTLLFVNYEQFDKVPFKRLSPYLRALSKWTNGQGAMILDESHMIKSPSSIRGRHIRPLAEQWKYRLIVTGTPVTNPGQVDAIYGQWTFLNPQIRERWRTARDFREYFGEWATYRGYPELVRPIRQYEMHAYIQPDVVTMIGPKHHLRTIRVDYPLPEEVQSKLRTMERDGVVQLCGHMILGLYPMTRLLRMRTLVAGWAKDDKGIPVTYHPALNRRLQVLQWLFCKKGLGKTIICCTHLEEIRLLTKYMDRHLRLSYRVIQGSTKQKNEVLQEFQQGTVHVLIVQPRTVSMAVDISAASNLIWYSSDFNYVTYKQASDRIKLSPQKPKVWFLCGRGSVDMDVWITLEEDHTHLEKTIARIKPRNYLLT